MEENNDPIVSVLWCGCATSINKVAVKEKMSAQTKSEYTRAKNLGLKVEDMTLSEFKTKPFMECDCE